MRYSFIAVKANAQNASCLREPGGFSFGCAISRVEDYPFAIAHLGRMLRRRERNTLAADPYSTEKYHPTYRDGSFHSA